MSPATPRATVLRSAWRFLSTTRRVEPIAGGQRGADDGRLGAVSSVIGRRERCGVVPDEVGDVARGVADDVLVVAGGEVAPAGRVGLPVLDEHVRDPGRDASGEQGRAFGLVGVGM